MCCDKPKPKKRRAKPKPQQEPILDEFPVLNTPALTRPNYGPMAMPIRNTVYMPPTVQISPEGMTPPIPNYFDRPYTNLVRTMEDFQNNIMNEMNDVKSLVSSRPMTNEMGTDPQMPTVDIPAPVPAIASTSSSPAIASTSKPSPPPMTNNALFGDEDIQGIADALQNFSISNPTTSGATTRNKEQKRRETLQGLKVKELQDTYYKLKGGRGTGALLTNKAILVQRIIDIELKGKQF